MVITEALGSNNTLHKLSNMTPSSHSSDSIIHYLGTDTLQTSVWANTWKKRQTLTAAIDITRFHSIFWMDHSSSILKRHTHFEAKRIHIKQTQRTLHSKKGDGIGGGAQNRGIGKRKKVATHSPFSHFLQTHRLHFLFSKFIRFIGYFYGRSSTHWILIILSSQKYVEMQLQSLTLWFVRKGPSPSFVDGQRASCVHSK